jgi:hypothetical protein
VHCCTLLFVAVQCGLLLQQSLVMIIKVSWAMTLEFSWTMAAKQLDILKALVLTNFPYAFEESKGSLPLRMRYIANDKQEA